jgi:microcystin-dependent protein
MSIQLDHILAQAANGSPATVALSSESVAVLLFASEFISIRRNWLDTSEDQMDEVTDADWDVIEHLVGEVYFQIMNPLIGWIVPNTLAVLPPNLLACDGATYAREDYPNLYAAMDSAFIVDADNFVVPDLRSRIPVGAGTGTGLSTYAVNEQGGEETHQLTTGEMPSHSHGLSETTSLAVEPGEAPVLIPFITELRSTGSAGGDEAHNNIQPYTAVPYAIVAF